jgi:hypothetical protein
VISTSPFLSLALEPSVAPVSLVGAQARRWLLQPPPRLFRHCQQRRQFFFRALHNFNIVTRSSSPRPPCPLTSGASDTARAPSLEASHSDEGAPAYYARLACEVQMYLDRWSRPYVIRIVDRSARRKPGAPELRCSGRVVELGTWRERMYRLFRWLRVRSGCCTSSQAANDRDAGGAVRKRR